MDSFERSEAVGRSASMAETWFVVGANKRARTNTDTAIKASWPKKDTFSSLELKKPLNEMKLTNSSGESSKFKRDENFGINFWE